MNNITIEQVKQLRELGLFSQLVFDFWVNPDSTDWLDIIEDPEQERRFAEGWTGLNGRYLIGVKGVIRSIDSMDSGSTNSYVKLEFDDGSEATVIMDAETEWEVDATWLSPYTQTEPSRSKRMRSIGPLDLTDLHAEMVRTNKILEPVLAWFTREWSKRNNITN